MHIVLADASRICILMLQQMLEEAGHTVMLFNDGLKARDYIAQDPRVDVLITGLELGSISGFELCWEARTLARANQSLYVIAMSSTNETSKLTEALDSGADEFINKPPAREELFARLRAAGRLAALQRKLFDLASTDPLTGIRNRRALEAEAQAAVARASDANPLSIGILDIDHFKQVNDTYGHDVGDLAIREVAQLAGSVGGIVGRLGGEEFALVFEGKTASEAADIAEKLRLKISEVTLQANQETVTFTCSIGICEWCPGDGVHDLLKRADLALYDAKRSGRDRVVIVRAERKVSAA